MISRVVCEADPSPMAASHFTAFHFYFLQLAAFLPGAHRKQGGLNLLDLLSQHVVVQFYCSLVS